MTKPELDLRAVLAKLKDTLTLLQEGAPVAASHRIAGMIGLLEPHVPKPPDPWLLEFDDLLARYVVQVTGSIQDWPPTKIALDALRNHVAAERARARGES